MAFQDTAGTIILDATLTDLGRRRMAQGKFKIEKFALGDDEVDYALGGFSGSRGDGYYYLFGDADSSYSAKDKFSTYEAHTTNTSNINYGLTDLPRNDILYLPQYFINVKVENSVKKNDNVIYLSVNEETSKKLKLYLNIDTDFLQDSESFDNMIILESGIQRPGELIGSKLYRDRFIYNLNLFDDYVFVHCNKNFVEKVMTNNPTAYFKNDAAGNLYQNLAPLSEQTKISLKGYLEEYDTYYCKAVQNNLIDYVDSDLPPAAANLSVIEGPRSSVLGLNFKVNRKMANKSNGASDRRYTLFGKTAQTLWSGDDTFDYVDTPVLIEGCSSTSKFEFTLRIIRYAGQ